MTDEEANRLLGFLIGGAVFGLLAGLIGLGYGFSGGEESCRQKAVEAGVARWHPQTREFEFIRPEEE